MENFITGYPGHEFQVRAELKKVLGEEKYEYFFDKVGSNGYCLELFELTRSSSSTSSPRRMPSSSRLSA